MDTPLMPVIIADGLVQEARDKIDPDLPDSLSDALATRAQTFYMRDDDFARKLQGDGGRETLRTQMGEWLVDRLKDRHPTAATLLAS